MSATLESDRTKQPTTAPAEAPATNRTNSETPPMASSPAAITAAEAPAAPAVRQRPNVAPIVLGVLALVGIAYGVQRWRWGINHIETDNAQVEGHVVPSSAKVSGY